MRAAALVRNSATVWSITACFLDWLADGSYLGG
jgi:hypothetical protein